MNCSPSAENMHGCVSRVYLKPQRSLNRERLRKLRSCQFLLPTSNCRYNVQCARHSNRGGVLSVQLAGVAEAEDTGGGAVGIAIVCPACNFRPSSMLLAFCNSSTLTLYILAMEVSVSPRATVCVFPFIGCEADSTGAAGVAGEGVF